MFVNTRYIEIGRDLSMALLSPIVRAYIKAHPGVAREIRVERDRRTGELVAYRFAEVEQDAILGGSTARERQAAELARQRAYETAQLNPSEEGMSEADWASAQRLNADRVGKTLWIGRAFPLEQREQAYSYAKLAAAATGRTVTVKYDRTQGEWVALIKTYVGE